MVTLSKNEYKGKKYKIFKIITEEIEIDKVYKEKPLIWIENNHKVIKYRLENQDFILDKRELGSWSEVVRFLKENDKHNWEKGAY